jgi:sec-independent protein translocase protein TatC
MSKDLFDDTTMTFGEHLEVLRVHLWKGIVGLVIGCTIAFFISRPIILAIQEPVTAAMEEKFGAQAEQAITDDRSPWQVLVDAFDRMRGKGADSKATDSQTTPPRPSPYLIHVDALAMARKLHELSPQQYPEPPQDAKPVLLAIDLQGTPLGKVLEGMRKESLKPRTDGPDEAFMIYLKVSLIVGLVIASPYVLFELWQFVAAGLYPHERKYVYRYLPLSVGLFLGGAAFCFFAVIPQVLTFLFEFNKWLDIRPEMRVGTWVTFALIVSVMFGVSFQLPLVMMFLDRISLLNASVYREKRRFAILAISVISMVLTPSDPVSMMMMMIPLCVLYELGIILCGKGTGKRSPFEAQAA